MTVKDQADIVAEALQLGLAHLMRLGRSDVLGIFFEALRDSKPALEEAYKEGAEPFRKRVMDIIRSAQKSLDREERSEGLSDTLGTEDLGAMVDRGGTPRDVSVFSFVMGNTNPSQYYNMNPELPALIETAIRNVRLRGGALAQAIDVAMLKYEDHLNDTEVAKHFSISESYVAVLLHRLRIALSDEVAKIQGHRLVPPVTDDTPEELHPARDAMRRRDLVEQERLLESLRPAWEIDPHWRFLRGRLAADKADYIAAAEYFRNALVDVDMAPQFRQQILNNWGLAEWNMGRHDRGRSLWIRAARLYPAHPTPWMNLLSDASDRRDYQDCVLYIHTLNRVWEKATPEFKKYMTTKITEDKEKDFRWLSTIDLWKRGPAKWAGRPPREGVVLVAAVLAVIALLISLGALAHRSVAQDTWVATFGRSEPTCMGKHIRLGKDSMGLRWLLVRGGVPTLEKDSMG